MPLEKWRMVLDTNLTGAFLFAQAAARHMIPRRYGAGRQHRIHRGPKKGVLPTGIHYSGYVASKGGLIALTRELAAKWAPCERRGWAPSRRGVSTHMTGKLMRRRARRPCRPRFQCSAVRPTRRVERRGPYFSQPTHPTTSPARPWRWMAAAPQFEGIDFPKEESNFMSDLIQLTRDGEVAIITN